MDAPQVQGEQAVGLPASFEAAWGRGGRPAKGPKRGMTIERIVEAAVAVAVADGLGAVSMSRVAKELGASTMALYRYVNAKDELLALMVDSAYGAAPEHKSREGWRPGLSRWAWSQLTGLRRHPWILQVPISGLALLGPNQNRWLESGLYSLRNTDLEPVEKMSTLLLVSGFVRNWATMSGDIRASFQQSGKTTEQQWMSSHGQLLAGLTDRAEFPQLHAVLDAGVFDSDDDPDDEFVFGLERILDGVQALIGSRQPAAE